MVSSIKNRIAAFEHLASTSKSQSKILEIVPPSPGFSVVRPKGQNVRAKETCRVVPELTSKRVNAAKYKMNDTGRSKEDDIHTYHQFRRKKIQIAGDGNNLNSTQTIIDPQENILVGSLNNEERSKGEDTIKITEESRCETLDNEDDQGGDRDGEMRDVSIEVSKNDKDSVTSDFDKTDMQEENDTDLAKINEIGSKAGPRASIVDTQDEIIVEVEEKEAETGNDEKDNGREENGEEEGPVSIIKVESKDQSHEEDGEQSHVNRDEQSVSPLSFLEHKIHNVDDKPIVDNTSSSVPESSEQLKEPKVNDHHISQGIASNDDREPADALSAHSPDSQQSNVYGSDEERDRPQHNVNQHNTQNVEKEKFILNDENAQKEYSSDGNSSETPVQLGSHPREANGGFVNEGDRLSLSNNSTEGSNHFSIGSDEFSDTTPFGLAIEDEGGEYFDADKTNEEAYRLLSMTSRIMHGTSGEEYIRQLEQNAAATVSQNTASNDSDLGLDPYRAYSSPEDMQAGEHVQTYMPFANQHYSPHARGAQEYNQTSQQRSDNISVQNFSHQGNNGHLNGRQRFSKGPPPTTKNGNSFSQYDDTSTGVSVLTEDSSFDYSTQNGNRSSASVASQRKKDNTSHNHIPFNSQPTQIFRTASSLKDNPTMQKERMGVTPNLSGTLSEASSKESRRDSGRKEKYREPPRKTLQKLAQSSQSNASNRTDGSERGRQKKKSKLARALRSMSPFRRSSKKNLNGSGRSKQKRERMPHNFEDQSRRRINNIDGGVYEDFGEKEAIPLVAVNLSDDSAPDRRSKRGFSFRSLSPFRRRGSSKPSRRNSRTSVNSDPFDEGISV